MKLKKLLLSASVLSGLAHAAPSPEVLLQDRTVLAEVQRLELQGAEFGQPQVTVLHSYYHTNSAQGERVLLSVEYHNPTKNEASALLSVFGRGGSAVYRFKKFVDPKSLAYDEELKSENSDSLKSFSHTARTFDVVKCHGDDRDCAHPSCAWSCRVR